jgi:hypothetical protein
VGANGPDRPPDGADSPKLAQITPKYINRVLHFGDVTVRPGTGPDQARVTGRIG